jgi:Autographiviridae endonuclease
MSRQRDRVPEIVRFWSKTERLPNGCLQWTAGCSKNGYALFGVRFPDRPSRLTTVLAHRWLYQRVFGELPPQIDVMHSCDNRACVALHHLSPGTRKSNMEDAVKKRRMSHGEKRFNHKLTDSKVRQIRRLYATGRWSQAVLADRFGVHQVAISLVLRGRTWRHVK